MSKITVKPIMHTNTSPQGQGFTCIETGKLYGASVYLSGDHTNCKLSYLHGCSGLVGLTDEQRKEFIDNVLIHAKGAVIVNTIKKNIADWFSKTYPLYYYNEVPIGYGTGFQYHLCIKNTVKPNSSCRVPQKTVNPEIESILLKVLKKYKRKTDYVKEFIELLKNPK